ncbi:MAG: hypothetical protein HZA46_03135 [Planctomycetales bacterium]|nr:hypothetical protein [Planctomycetales bacterium]
MIDDPRSMKDTFFVIVFILAIPCVIFMCVLCIRSFNQLRRAKEAFAKGNYAESFSIYKRVAAQYWNAVGEFKVAVDSKGKFDRSIDGIREIYLAVGIDFDLAQLIELRSDYLSLHKDKSYFSPHNGGSYTTDGEKVVKAITDQFWSKFNELPSVSAEQGGQPERR